MVRLFLFALALSLVSCGLVRVEPLRPIPEVEVVRVITAMPPPVTARALAPVQDPILPEGDALGPELLLPRDADDATVVRIGDLELRKSHVFDRLLSRDPDLAMKMVDLLVLDALVAKHAETHGIRVDRRQVEELAEREERILREGVASQFGGRRTFEDYVRSAFAMEPEAFRNLVRLRRAQTLFHDLVIRFMAMRKDRVRVRFLVHRDRELVETIARKVKEGADFGSLALQHSEDSSSLDNGLLPPFGPGFRHPIAEHAFQLQAGELSPILEHRAEGTAHYYLVYCLERLPGRPDLTFAAVRDQLLTDLEDAHRTTFETEAYIALHAERLEQLGGIVRMPGNPVLNKEQEKR